MFALTYLMLQVFKKINATYSGLQSHGEFRVQPFVSLVSRFSKRPGNSIVDIERVYCFPIHVIIKPQAGQLPNFRIRH